MGFGAMQLPGPGVFGPPKDRDIALRVLRRATEAGVNHIDTAQFYGPDVANELLREALSPYPDDLVIVSKVGAARDDQGQWHGAQRPDQLRAGVEANLESLGLEQIPVVNLRRHPESDVLFTDQLEAMEAMRQEGLIGGIGLSNVDLEQYRTAQSLIEIACVQNPYNLLTLPERTSSTPAGRMTFPLSHFSLWAPPSILRSQFFVRPPSRRRLVDSVQHQLKLRSPGY
jgi:pyridoxine 4-dehydrogenase